MMKNLLLNLTILFSITSSLPSISSLLAPKASEYDTLIVEPVESSLIPIESDKYLSMKTYFRHLYTNMPENDFGSCGFISLVACLSYYDSYFNDAIIPEKFDVKSYGLDVKEAALQSPGVTKVKNTTSLTNYTNDKRNAYIKNFIVSNKAYDFQYDLMYTYNTEVLNKDQRSSKYETSIGMWDYQNLLDAYYGSNKIYYHYVTSSIYGANPLSIQLQIKQYVYECLEEGYPVILHIVDERNDKSKYYHSIVAYDYDIDVLDCNFGYNNSNYSDVNLNQHKYYITEAGRLDIKGFSETHSSNYVINGKPYCGCGQKY